MNSKYIENGSMVTQEHHEDTTLVSCSWIIVGTKYKLTNFP